MELCRKHSCLRSLYLQRMVYRVELDLMSDAMSLELDPYVCLDSGWLCRLQVTRNIQILFNTAVPGDATTGLAACLSSRVGFPVCTSHVLLVYKAQAVVLLSAFVSQGLGCPHSPKSCCFLFVLSRTG